MKQILMSFLRCQAKVKRQHVKPGPWRTEQCDYKAKYGRFCGHHRRNK